MPSRRDFPETTPSPCNECPWRTKAVPGHLGPYTAHDWIKIVHGEQPIACHKTIVPGPNGVGDWEHPRMRQCRGAAIFRSNVGKLPKHPEIETGPYGGGDVFETNDDFVIYHGEAPMEPGDLYSPLSTESWREHEIDLEEKD